MSSKPIITSFILAALLLLGAFTSSFGQNPDICKPDCQSSQFGPTQVDTLILPGGCVVRVFYAVRMACNIWYDLGIVSIEALTPGCGLFTVKQILDFTTLEMLRTNPMGFPDPDSGRCTTQWRVVNGACWKDSVTFHGDSIYVPCNLVACCLSSYRVCLDSLGNRTSTKLSSGSAKDCDTTDPHCTPVCGDSSSSLTSPQDPGLSNVEIKGLRNVNVEVKGLHGENDVPLGRETVVLAPSVSGRIQGTVSATGKDAGVVNARE